MFKNQKDTIVQIFSKMIREIKLLNQDQKDIFD